MFRLGQDATAAVIVHEELSASDPAFCLSYLAHSMLFVNNLAFNGNGESIYYRHFYSWTHRILRSRAKGPVPSPSLQWRIDRGDVYERAQCGYGCAGPQDNRSQAGVLRCLFESLLIVGDWRIRGDSRRCVKCEASFNSR